MGPALGDQRECQELIMKQGEIGYCSFLLAADHSASVRGLVCSLPGVLSELN